MVEVHLARLDQVVAVRVVPGVVSVSDRISWIHLPGLVGSERFRIARVARLEDRVAVRAQRIRDAYTRLPVIPCEWPVLTGVIHRWKNLRERGIALDGRRPVVSVLPVPAHAEIN